MAADRAGRLVSHADRDGAGGDARSTSTAASVVPGLLQTRDYAGQRRRRQRSATRLMPEADRAAVERAGPSPGDSRTRAKPPELRVVIDEAVLARTTGGRGGDERPAGASRGDVDPSRSLDPGRSASSAASIPAAPEVTIILVDMGEELPDVLYREGIDAPEDTSDGRRRLDEYWQGLGASPERSLSIITRPARRSSEYRSRLAAASHVGDDRSTGCTQAPRSGV